MNLKLFWIIMIVLLILGGCSGNGCSQDGESVEGDDDSGQRGDAKSAERSVGTVREDKPSVASKPKTTGITVDD